MSQTAARLRADANRIRAAAQGMTREQDAAAILAIAHRYESEAASLEAMERHIRTSAD